MVQSMLYDCQSSSQTHDMKKSLWLIAYGKRKPDLFERVSKRINAFRKSLTILIRCVVLCLCDICSILCKKRPGNHFKGRSHCNLQVIVERSVTMLGRTLRDI